MNYIISKKKKLQNQQYKIDSGVFLYSFFFNHFRIPYIHMIDKIGPNHFNMKRNVF